MALEYLTILIYDYLIQKAAKMMAIEFFCLPLCYDSITKQNKFTCAKNQAPGAGGARKMTFKITYTNFENKKVAVKQVVPNWIKLHDFDKKEILCELRRRATNSLVDEIGYRIEREKVLSAPIREKKEVERLDSLLRSIEKKMNTFKFSMN